MAKPLPMPAHDPGPEAERLLAALRDFAAAEVPDDQETLLHRLSDWRHLMIATEAHWEAALAVARERVRGRAGGGWNALKRDTQMPLSTMQYRLAEAPARRAEERRAAGHRAGRPNESAA